MAQDIFDSSDSVRSGRKLQYVQNALFPQGLALELGGHLPEINVAFETYGTLNADASNAILICHALSGDSHVASHNAQDDFGWWEILVGPNKPVDTNKFFLVCPNVLGGCRGTTGPDRTADFPAITIGDIVETQRMLADYLGIHRFHAIIGGSIGGLMTLEWATRFPDRLSGAVAVATGAHLTSQALAFDIVGRNAIQSDPQFHNGQYNDKGTTPANGLAIARMLGHITYLSKEAMQRKFAADRNAGRDMPSQFETKFSVGSYLAYQGSRFVERFDANSYLTLTMAMDTYDLGETKELLATNLRKSMCRWLLLSFTSDWLFPPYLSKEIVDALLGNQKRVSFCNVQSDCGHDAFLLKDDFESYGEMIRGFLDNLEPCLSPKTQVNDLDTPKKHRIDYDKIVSLIPRDASVLDLGCGNGKLLSRLLEQGNRRVLGLEIDENLVMRSMQLGIDVVQADLNEGLPFYKDKQFDFVILSKTLQTVRDVDFVLEEMLRVGTLCIVSFPNLGFHEYRRQLYEAGRAPIIDPILGRHWHDSHDVRFLTIADFDDYCAAKGYRIHQKIALNTQTGQHITDNPNLNADIAIAVLSR